jgi:hypothetical protein
MGIARAPAEPRQSAGRRGFLRRSDDLLTLSLLVDSHAIGDLTLDSGRALMPEKPGDVK